MKHPIILIAALFLGISFTQAQKAILTQTIKGVVIDQQSGNPLRNATIVVEGSIPAISSNTDSQGVFKLVGVPIGRQNIRTVLVGYENATSANIEVTSSKEVVLEIKLKEKISLLKEVVVTSGKQKNRALNEAAVVSARQLSMDEAVRYSGTRNDPSRMAQNFAGVSGTNDARNDIVIRGNSPTGVLWRMDGIDIPNPNHFGTLGSTGGPVTILNTNMLKNSDFITSAFPAQYGNALAGVFDLRMRNGNNEKYEYLGQMGFNGFEFGAEGPFSKNSKSSFLVNYRYSLVAAIQKLGLNVGTGSATPYYQDASFKLHFVTKKSGTIDIFGLGGESHINFPPDSSDNLYTNNDGKLRNSNTKSLTGVIGATHTYFFNPRTSGKFTLALSAFQSKYNEEIIETGKPDKSAYVVLNKQTKISIGYNFNQKLNAQNQISAGLLTDVNLLNLQKDYLPNGSTVLTTLTNAQNTATLTKGFGNWMHRFNNQVSTNLGVYAQWFSLNNSVAVEPRWNLKYQFQPNQSLSLGAGLHSQTQPLDVYFYQSTNGAGQTVLSNKDLGFVRSLHGVMGYDINFSSNLRFKTEVYAQYIYDAATESKPSSFSMLNAGAGFAFPEKFYLQNQGKGSNYGVEFTLEKFLNKGFYYLVTGSLFESKYKGSDQVLRNTAFNSNYVFNLLGGKEWKLSKLNSFGIDTKFAIAGGQRYTPFDIPASKAAGFVIYQEDKAFSLQNDTYLRWDLKFSFTRNGPKATQKWYVDFQNLTNHKNIFVRTLNPSTGQIKEINQIGFFPNINYQITF
ncbi:MAG: TonB-dependent receptor [Chitinophagaceae bacterium BSSC1]|nr:MAG: TonB-dependent receptor [Chitinophagaceae bacterium BSSC1]